MPDRFLDRDRVDPENTSAELERSRRYAVTDLERTLSRNTSIYQMLDAYQNELLLDCITDGAVQTVSLRNVTTQLTPETLEQAEAHGLSPLLHEILKADHQTTGDAGMRVLRGLALRHRHHARTRREVLATILPALAQAGVETLVLKGAALAHTVYPRPELRPMGDIDLLVRPRELQQAREVLMSIGSRATAACSDFVFRHHHLPALVIEAHGDHVIVELHHDALSGDVPESVTLDALRDDPLDFSIGDVRARTLGHEDCLLHLCRHGFEPGGFVRLIHVADILRYAHRYADRIDWQQIREQLPLIPNTIRCLGYVTALPQPLLKIVSAPPGTRVSGVGQTFKPLSEVLAPPRRFTAMVKELFLPSAWWMHVYYNVPPENSLLRYRLLNHPARLLRWLARRYQAFFMSKLSAHR